MTTYTRAELATRILKDINIVAVDEEPDASLQADAEVVVGSVAAQLESENIVIVNGSVDELPEAYLVPMAKRVALDIGGSYGLYKPAEVEAAKPLANAALRRMNSRPPTGGVAEAEYF